MAATVRKISRPIFNRIVSNARQLHHKTLPNKTVSVATACACGTAAAITLYAVSKARNVGLSEPVFAKEKEPDASETKARVVQTQRELRFLSFASVEYEGNVYMTPQDFLESVMEEAPRPRTGRMRLRKEELDKFLNHTPSKGKGNVQFFRNLHDRGIISYTEYLFLLCVLTKPRSGFRIAFNMFDTDGNQRVDKKEFLVLEKIITQAQKDAPEHMVLQDTTLLRHFFGRRGHDVLKYEDFHRFMENLQVEVLELEFNEFARGMPTITEEEFANILLRYTILNKDEQADYIKRLRERIPHVKGVTFQDFKEFGQFLNNLDDFAIAMRMYTFTDQPISESEFKRAVKVCTGQSLNDHLVHTVFQLFDIDGDGHLSHKEFISVMKDRLHRGFRAAIQGQNRWDMFKSCVKNEMRHH